MKLHDSVTDYGHTIRGFRRTTVEVLHGTSVILWPLKDSDRCFLSFTGKAYLLTPFTL